MSHFQEQGRAAYKRKDHAKALDLFDRAIGRMPSAQLYDNRSACHEKLGDLPAALSDAKKTIQLAREDPTGYLRAGKVLLKMEKRGTAAEIYSYGMRSIKHVGQGYELLRKAQKDLMNELSPAKSVDPLTMLPPELAVQVLEYVSFKQLMNVCLVSKEWTKFIRGNPDLWTYLDLSGANRKVGSKFISRAMNIARKRMKRAYLYNLYDADKALRAISTQCPIEDLTLRYMFLPPSEMTKCLSALTTLRRLHISHKVQILIQPFYDMLSAASNLKVLRCDDLVACHSVPGNAGPSEKMARLTDLDVTWQHFVAEWSVVFGGLLGRPVYFPDLRRLRIDGPMQSRMESTHLEHFGSLEHLELRAQLNPIRGWRLPPALRTLHIDQGNAKRSVLFEVAIADPECWPTPQLEVLILKGMQGAYLPNCLQWLDNSNSVESPVHLNTLFVTGCALRLPSDAETAAQVVRAALKHPRLGSLTHLNFEECSYCDDTVIGVIADTLPKLQILNVSKTDITGVGVKLLVQSGSLKELIVNDCRNLGHDAVVWARNQGVKVECSSSDVSGMGKKVRY
ncbi:hypothetical protein B0A48_05864 [Cryoendolithus antarcticus]|uniref:F-box domain-containing protein n=1 Tax=Cryoendolithus antarcticus TaxID=1507870 RepID=A0A1V8TCG7_9PEZI|nr:hypothetical protein B0A48_05864 [Cryoendolithus antarcticus]